MDDRFPCLWSLGVLVWSIEGGPRSVLSITIHRASTTGMYSIAVADWEFPSVLYMSTVRRVPPVVPGPECK